MDNPLHNGGMDDCFGDMLYNYKAEPDETVWDNIQQQIDPLSNLETKFQDYKVEPDGFVWNQVKKDIAPKNKNRFPYKRLLSIAALLLLPILIAQITWEQSPDPSTETLQSQSITEKQISSKTFFSVDNLNKELITGTPPKIVSDTKISNNQPKAIQQNRKNYVVGNYEEENVLRPKKSIGNLQTKHIIEDGKEAKQVFAFNEKSKVNQLTERASYGRSLISKNLVSINNTTKFENGGESLSAINALFYNAIHKANKIEKLSLKEPTLKQINPVFSKRKKSISSFIGRNTHQWEVIHNEAEDHKEWNGEIKNFATWSTGLFIDFPINEHWSLKTGLMTQRFYSRIIVEADIRPTDIEVNELYKHFEVDLVMHNHFYQVMANGRKIGASFPLAEKILMTSEQSLQYLSIPIYVEYTVNPKQKIKVALTTGINSNILLQNKIELLDFEVDGAFINGFSLSNSKGLSNLNWSYTGGMSLTYPLGNHWSGYAQALYTHSLTKINKGDLHKSTFTSIGLQTGLKFSF